MCVCVRARVCVCGHDSHIYLVLFPLLLVVLDPGHRPVPVPGPSHSPVPGLVMVLGPGSSYINGPCFLHSHFPGAGP